MKTERLHDANPATLSIKIGTWFEANATGWGVVAAILGLALVVGMTILEWWAAR